MAKIKPKWRTKTTTRRFPVTVTLHRVGDAISSTLAFEACARVGGKNRGGSGSLCGYGRNPRKAAGEALKKLGKALTRRTGAYAGLR